jgi:hypothetical protein
LMPSGTGNFARAGIFCIADSTAQGTAGIGRIQRVLGTDADIRGDIVSNTGIGEILLSNGSIINADIGISETSEAADTGSGLDVQSQEFGNTADVIPAGNVGGRVLGNIDSITTIGYGGIIGLTAYANNMGPVTVQGGFGIINSSFGILGNGRFDDVIADGYGVRGVTWFGGQSIDSIHARGTGKRLTTTSFSPGVRFSEVAKIDPYFGTRPNALTDLHIVIGTTAAAPQRKGTSSSGSIDLSTIQVSRDAGILHGVTMRLNLFNVPNNIDQMITDSYMDSVEVTTGRVGMLAIGGDGLRNDIQVAGPVAQMHVRGNWRGSSHLFATGDNGAVESINIKGSQFGDIYAQDHFGTVTIGRAYGSMGTRTAGSMAAFNVGGDVLTGAILTVEKELTTLNIGGNLEDGALIRVGTLGTKTIGGQEIGVVDTKPWET